MTTTLEPTHHTRHLPLEGTYNVRDIGGYATEDGRETRWRTLLRADSLHRIPVEAQRELIAAGLSTVIDLRRRPELEEWPNVFAASDRVAYLNLNLVGESRLLDGESWTLGDLYCAMLDRRQDELRTVFATLAAPGGLPGLVHCTAGKDRTGLVIALALALAGVPRETIVNDYCLTADYLTGQYMAEARLRAEASGYTWDRYQLQLACPPEYMTQALDHLDAQYGGAEAYLRAAGLADDQIAALRTALVGPLPR